MSLKNFTKNIILQQFSVFVYQSPVIKIRSTLKHQNLKSTSKVSKVDLWIIL